MSPPILIVGAGPAGLTLARSLARRGRAVRVFDAQCRRPERGLGLWGRAQAALRTLGHGDLLDDAVRALRGGLRIRLRGAAALWFYVLAQVLDAHRSLPLIGALETPLARAHAARTHTLG